MKSIEIHNFRCFNHLTVDLAPGINLFIGDNASGKTSLLWACKYAVNCFFSGFSDLYTSWSTPRQTDFTRLLRGEKRLASPPIRLSFNFSEEEMPGSGVFSLASASQTLCKASGKNSRPRLSGLKQLRDYGRYLCNPQINDDDNSVVESPELPLIASFSTHGIHKNQKISTKYFTEYAQTPSFGYYMCHSTDGLVEYWIRRLLVLQEADSNPVERRIVLDTLERMFGSEGCGIMDGFDVRVNYKDIICRFKDGREIPVSILSDGYRRLFSIVIDLAFRCALLNSHILGVEAALRTHGTVIIDEIDLHLHPSLQAVVTKALHNTFPNLQFIITSHAPLVMSGVENNDRNSVLYLEYDTENRSYTIGRVDTFGMDLSTLAESVLNVPAREASVDRSLSRLYEMLDREDYAEARVLLQQMRNRFGDRIPELSGIETQITIFDDSQDNDSD